jgi:hypothetical protein
MSKNSQIQTIFIKLLEYQQNVKLFHFQTKIYSAHKASDDLYNSLTEQIDKLFEAWQGKTQRIPLLETSHVLLKSFSEREIISYTTTMDNYINKITTQISSKHPELVNILTDIQIALDKFLYLMKFEK